MHWYREWVLRFDPMTRLPARWALALLTLASVAGAVALPHRADACARGTTLHHVLPGENATEEPTNARIWAVYQRVGVEAPRLRLLDAAGAEVPARLVHHDEGVQNALTPRVMSLSPRAPLSPSSRYTVELWTADRGAFERVHAFTTGAAADDEAPTPVASAQPEATRLDRTCSCCSPRVSVELRGATVAGAVAYRVYSMGQVLGLAPEMPAVIELPADTAPGRRCVHVLAVDVAGNESPRGERICVDLPPQRQ